MNITLIISVIILVLAVVISAAIVLLVALRPKKHNQRSEIHISGGANVENGRITSDNNYFKGLSGALGYTVSIDSRSAYAPSAFPVTIKNDAGGVTQSVPIYGKLIIGRDVNEQAYIINDKSVSRQHCALTVQNGKLFLSDLGSLNHTYVNGRQVVQNTEVHSGDTVKVGKVKLEIFFDGR